MAATKRVRAPRPAKTVVGGNERSDRVGESIDKRDALIEAGIELFSSMPYEDISVDALAARAGVGHGMISYHFGSKRGLFADVVAAIWADFIEYEQPRVGETTPREIVRGFLRRNFEFARTYPERYELMFSTHADHEVTELLERAKIEALTEVKDALGCPKHPSPLFLAAVHGWHGYIEGVTMEWLADSTLDIEVLTEMCLAVLVTAVNAVNGVLPSAELEDAVLVGVAGPRPSK